MSKYLKSSKKRISILDLKQRKIEGKKISMITCYDTAFAEIIDASEIDIVLVGDSLGNVVLGFENTIPVQIKDMIHHGAAVSRGLERAFLCVDMPFLSYHLSCEQALENAGEILQKTLAQAVKLEGGRVIAPQVRALVNAGIPVMGHLGLTPQSVHSLGGFKVQGKTEEAEQILFEDALALAEAGVFSLVLEMVPAELAKKITQALKIPTIGIGAGSYCDGQVLVLHDMLGFSDEFNPKFLRKYLNLGELVGKALTEYDQDVKNQKFPSEKESF